MVWKAYLVSFRLLSPMHIGWRKLGNLQQTRPYVTGRNLWGALTARLTRELGGSNYQEIGEQIDTQLAFTYFYPSKQPEEVSLWPWGEKRDEFAWAFLGSYASTALEDSHSAEPGSLHETEFIAVRTRDAQQVYMVGYIFEKSDCQLDWKSALGKLQLGGERGYGWGRVEGKWKEVKDNRCFDYDLDCEGDYPLLTASEEVQLLAHLRASDIPMEGIIEPLVGRETETNTGSFGKTLSKAEICWTPGSKVIMDGKFLIKKRGIWEFKLGTPLFRAYL